MYYTTVVAMWVPRAQTPHVGSAASETPMISGMTRA